MGHCEECGTSITHAMNLSAYVDVKCPKPECGHEASFSRTVQYSPVGFGWEVVYLTDDRHHFIDPYMVRPQVMEDAVGEKYTLPVPPMTPRQQQFVLQHEAPWAPIGPGYLEYLVMDDIRQTMDENEISWLIEFYKRLYTKRHARLVELRAPAIIIKNEKERADHPESSMPVMLLLGKWDRVDTGNWY